MSHGQFGLIARMRAFVENGIESAIRSASARHEGEEGVLAGQIVAALQAKAHNWRRPTPLIPSAPWPRIVFSREAVARDARIAGHGLGDVRTMTVEFSVVIGNLDIIVSNQLPSLDETAYESGLLIMDGMEHLFESRGLLVDVLGEGDAMDERTQLLSVAKHFEISPDFDHV